MRASLPALALAVLIAAAGPAPAADPPAQRFLDRQRVGGAVYFHVRFWPPDDRREPEPEEPFADPALLPREGAAEVYSLAGVAADGRPLPEFDFIGKWPGDGPARLLLTYPKRGGGRAEAPVTLNPADARWVPPSRLSPAPGVIWGDDLPRLWAAAKARPAPLGRLEKQPGGGAGHFRVSLAEPTGLLPIDRWGPLDAPRLEGLSGAITAYSLAGVEAAGAVGPLEFLGRWDGDKPVRVRVTYPRERGTRGQIDMVLDPERAQAVESLAAGPALAQVWNAARLNASLVRRFEQQRVGGAVYFRLVCVQPRHPLPKAGPEPAARLEPLDGEAAAYSLTDVPVVGSAWPLEFVGRWAGDRPVRFRLSFPGPAGERLAAEVVLDPADAQAPEPRPDRPGLAAVWQAARLRAAGVRHFEQQRTDGAAYFRVEFVPGPPPKWHLYDLPTLEPVGAEAVTYSLSDVPTGGALAFAGRWAGDRPVRFRLGYTTAGRGREVREVVLDPADATPAGRPGPSELWAAGRLRASFLERLEQQRAGDAVYFRARFIRPDDLFTDLGPDGPRLEPEEAGAAEAVGLAGAWAEGPPQGLDFVGRWRGDRPVRARLSYANREAGRTVVRVTLDPAEAAAVAPPAGPAPAGRPARPDDFPRLWLAARQRAAGLLCLEQQTAGGVTYFRVRLPEPPDLKPRERWGPLDPPTLLPLDGRAAALGVGLVRAAGGAHPLDFAGRWPGDEPMTFRLTYPTLRGVRQASVTFAPALAAPGAGLPELWAAGEGVSAAAEKLARYAALDAPDFGFAAVARSLINRRTGLDLPEVAAAESPSTPAALRLFELVTGSAAVTESLQLRRRLTARGPVEQRTVRVRDLPGVDLPEHPWEQMTGDRKPADEPLAGLVPHDNYYVRFNGPGPLLEFLGLQDLWGPSLLRAFEYRDRDADVRRRYERQLALPADRVAAALDPKIVRGIAVTGSDARLGDGSDLAVIFHAADPAALRAALEPFVREAREAHLAGLTETTEDFQGVAVSVLTTPGRELSLYRATVGEFVIHANSPAGLRRVLDAQAGRRPALAGQRDYRYMRTVFRADDAAEAGFGYLSDAFIRRLVGPAYRVSEARRDEALNALRLATYAALYAGCETGRLPADTAALLTDSGLRPEELRSPDEPGIAWDGRSAASAVYGSLRFATPLIELPVMWVTPAERDDYARFRADYLRLWGRFSDPVGLRLGLRGREVRLEAYILPVVRLPEYAELRRYTGDPVAAGAAPPGTVLQWSLGLSADPRGNRRGHVATVSLRLGDDPVLARLVGLADRWSRGRVSDEEFAGQSLGLVGQLDLVLAVDAHGDRVISDACEQVRGMLPLFLGNGGTLPPKQTYRGITVDRFPGAPLLELLSQGGWRNLDGMLHVARVGGVYYVTSTEAAMHAAIDRALDAENTPAPAEAERANGSLLVSPAAARHTRGAVEAYLEDQTARRALANAPIWELLHRAGVLAADAAEADRRAAALRTLGFVPASPDGEPYAFDPTARTVSNRRHGTAARPTPHEGLAEGAPLRRVLDEFRSVRVSLSFREDGIHTVLTIDRAPR